MGWIWATIAIWLLLLLAGCGNSAECFTAAPVIYRGDGPSCHGTPGFYRHDRVLVFP